MIINNINCPNTKETFVLLVWLYGAQGTSATENLSDKQTEVVAMAWADVEPELDSSLEEYEIDEIIGTYYNDFVKAGN